MALTPQDVQAKKAEITAEGGLFELESVELDGYSYKSYKHAPKTLLDVFNAARGHGDLEFMVYEDQRYSYSEFFAAADALAASLQQDFGIARGDRVAIAMRNNAAWAIAYTAITFVGGIVVPINSWGKSEELRYALEDSGSKLLVCDVQRLALIEPLLPELGVKVLLAEGDSSAVDGNRVHDFNTVVEAGRGREVQVPEMGPQDACVILYTSGSTGFPKGVLHRHISLCQSLMNMFCMGYLTMELEGGAREFKGGAERETPLLTVPLFHATGLLSGFLLPLNTAQKVVMMYKWDAARALELIEAEKVTSLSSVPAIIQDFLHHPDFDKHDTSTLFRVTAAGAATPAGLPELIREKCGEPSRSAGWGMTETVAVGAIMSGAIYDLNPEASGIQSPVVDMRFVDPQGNVKDSEEGGEIEVYSICCTPGYWHKPEANASTFTERWMKTGDLARIDADGFLHITGRLKEIVIRGGENIYPGEIEQAVYELPQVKENVVFGVPDEAMGEEMALVLHLHEGQALSEEELRDYLKGRLAAYKIPKYIQFRDEPLPQNASGKLHKLNTRARFLGEA